jgi:NADH-quinone oxidoreductase subunit L
MNALDPAALALATCLMPLLAFAVLGLVPRLRRSHAATWVAIACAAGSTLTAGLLLANRLQPGVEPVLAQVDWLSAGGQVFARVGVLVDGVSAAMLVVVTVVALCVQVFSLGYMHAEEPAALGRYYTWHSLFLASMLGLVVSPNALQLFMCWELVGLASYLLIGFYFQKVSAGQAAVKAFWVTKFADVGLGAGLLVLFVQTRSFDWSPAAIHALGTGGATAVAALFLLAVMGKSAQFPLHIWLPDAMEGPTPVSALLHAATMVAAGVYLVVRAYPIFQAAPDVLTFMAWLGAWTALYASVIACAQDDIKKVLAYSTAAQLGYMISGLGSGEAWPGFFHLVTHAAFKALLFLGAGALIHAVHSNSLRDMGGLGRKLPWSGGAFVIGALALAGIPGLSGFFSKDAILDAVLASHHTGPWLLLLLAAGLTAFYMTRVVVLALLGTAGPRTEHAVESPPSMLWPLLLLAVLAVGIGYLGTPLAAATGQHFAFHWSVSGGIASGLGVLGIGTAWAMYGAKVLDASAWAPIAAVNRVVAASAVDRSAAWAYRSVLLRVSAGVAWFDRYIVDGLINLTAWLTLTGGQRGRKVQTGRSADYLYAVVAGLLLLTAISAWHS